MRRAPAEVRKLEPDPIYRSVLVTQVINKVLWRGKKGAARRIVYGSLETVQKRTGDDPVKVLKRAIDNMEAGKSVAKNMVPIWVAVTGNKTGAKKGQTAGPGR